MWLIEASRLEDAVAILSEVAENNPAQADQAATMIFNEAHINGFQQEDFEYSITGMAAASRLLADTGEYAASVNVVLAQLLEDIGAFIETQEALIRRGRRPTPP